MSYLDERIRELRKALKRPVGTQRPAKYSFKSTANAQQDESNHLSTGTLDSASEVDRAKGCVPTTLVNQHNDMNAKPSEVTRTDRLTPPTREAQRSTVSDEAYPSSGSLVPRL